jgi:MFS family permease
MVARETAVQSRQQAGRHRRPLERGMSYGIVLAVREFRWLSIAQALSFLGDQFAQVAIALLVYDRTGSPLLTGLAYALTYLPPIVGGPLLSVLADMFPRRRVMVICDLVRMVTVGLMALPGLSFPALCALLFVTVLLGAPFFAARAALMADILRADQLGIGAAISNITHQATQIIGFVIGAAVVAILGANQTLGLDAASFAISAVVVLAAVRPRPAPKLTVARPQHAASHRHRARRASVRGVSADGIRLVFGDPVLRTLLLFGWLAGFYVVPEGLAAPYAHALGGSAITVGLLMAAAPAGTVVGGVLAGRLATLSDQLRMMGWLAMLSCAPLIAGLWNPPLWAVLALWFLAGIGGSFQIIASPAFARALTPQTRARAFGVVQSGLYAVQGLGILAGGAAASALGAQAAVAVAGFAGLCAAIGLAVSWSRLRSRALDRQ